MRGRGLNNRAENSHQPFRRRERAMQRFRSVKTLQKFSAVLAQVHNHFNQERHLVTREFTSRDALPHWPSGAPSRLKLRLRVAVLRHAQTTCSYSDKACAAHCHRIEGQHAEGDEGDGDPDEASLYYKAGYVPWRLPRDPSQFQASYVGISFYRDLSGQRLLTSTDVRRARPGPDFARRLGAHRQIRPRARKLFAVFPDSFFDTALERSVR